MRTEAIGVLAAAAVLAGCGSEPSSAGNFEGVQRDVADVVESLEAAGKRREPERICADLLSASLRQRLAAGRSQCEDEVRDALEDADVFDLDVRNVTVSGSRATARVQAEDEAQGVQRTLELVQERGRWRIDSLGA